jgi:hypothetical protein
MTMLPAGAGYPPRQEVGARPVETLPVRAREAATSRPRQGNTKRI